MLQNLTDRIFKGIRIILRLATRLKIIKMIVNPLSIRNVKVKCTDPKTLAESLNNWPSWVDFLTIFELNSIR